MTAAAVERRVCAATGSVVCRTSLITGADSSGISLSFPRATACSTTNPPDGLCVGPVGGSVALPGIGGRAARQEGGGVPEVGAMRSCGVRRRSLGSCHACTFRLDQRIWPLQPSCPLHRRLCGAWGRCPRRRSAEARTVTGGPGTALPHRRGAARGRARAADDARAGAACGRGRVPDDQGGVRQAVHPAMLPTLEDLCREWRPDLVVHEMYELASVVAAERHGVPHAQVAVSAAQFAESTDELLRPILDSYGAGIAERLRASPYLTRLPASLDPSPYAVTRRYHQPPAPSALPDRWDGSEEPLVYVTLGTEVGGMPNASALYRAVLASVSGLPARVLLTTGPLTDVSDFGPVPRTVHVERWVPQADVLGSASLVLCHGGSGTVYSALDAGVPLVCVPLFADQPTNAGLVTGAGAGLTVTADEPGQGPAGFGPDGVARLRAAVELVLREPSYRAGAERLAAEMRATPTAGELLDSLGAAPAPGLR
ncbi:glycosyltransferase [Streptomyces atratus]|uniref:glycosyltransferase n=1 Tax=Streptomyces atratus TaxID=1893 RepID=UPI0033CD8621